MVTAAQTVLEPIERVRAGKRSEAALTTLEPAARVRAKKGHHNPGSTRLPGRSEERHPDGAGVHLHTRTFHPPVPIPYLSLEKLPARLEKVPIDLEKLPTRDLAFYGGLGALAVAGALEWPVALAIGGATWLVRSRRRTEH
ncbi:hypothetical protein RKE30_02215 [Streptomyces sp. Li-HN-5-11]|uniref:hypothetical protein n=1 Tax=Streptomyces sp. Li-HN-5-11 TaxID=3075432 RepID=UPI0028A82F5F|nr:hypothetical protein [Streptomyces sp. Li-HN-5-11]WNM29294.1 hypothetical protein RKE30_02215 [Streptomyces sp. Li-HN-5-11]